MPFSFSQKHILEYDVWPNPKTIGFEENKTSSDIMNCNTKYCIQLLQEKYLQNLEAEESSVHLDFYSDFFWSLGLTCCMQGLTRKLYFTILCHLC